MRVSVVFSVVMLCVQSFVALAEEPEPQPEERRVFIGYLHHDTIDLTADEAARKLDRDDELFDPTFAGALQSPLHAESLTRFPCSWSTAPPTAVRRGSSIR